MVITNHHCDHSQVLAGSGDATTTLWDVESGTVLQTFHGHVSGGRVTIITIIVVITISRLLGKILQVNKSYCSNYAPILEIFAISSNHNNRKRIIPNDINIDFLYFIVELNIWALRSDCSCVFS